ncbi:MAG: phosphate transport system protein [Thermotogaceae bacterium]|nr:phosphate transport system protein [Thermotogaceae bacterium]
MEQLHHFEREIDFLRSKISKMLLLVTESLENSIKSLESRDLNLANRVLEMDDLIDQTNRDTENEVFQIIGRYTPLSKNLRYVIAMIKFSNDLERIGDLACNIAEKTVKVIENNLDFRLTKELKDMVGTAIKMVKEAVKSFSNRDLELAKRIWKEDDIVDDLQVEIIKLVENKVKSDDSFQPELISIYILLAHDIERIADHATNLCEEVIYIETGKNITDVL